MRPKKLKQYKTCDLCGRVGLLGYAHNPIRGWLYDSDWMCKNVKACNKRVEERKKALNLL